MKVVILCGGKGLRLLSTEENIPKPLVEIGDKPILWHIMKIYSHYGYKDFILCLGYKGDKIKEYFMRHDTWEDVDFTVNLKERKKIKLHKPVEQEDWNITFADTGVETNTGGRVKRIEKYIDEDEFFLTYGDGVSDININELYDYHKKHGKIMTMTCVRPQSPFGIIDINKENLIMFFHEKPQADYWINGGFCVCNKKIFNFLGENDILEVETIPKFIERKELVAYRYDRFWQCMDTLKHVQILNEMWKSGNAEWKLWE